MKRLESARSLHSRGLLRGECHLSEPIKETAGALIFDTEGRVLLGLRSRTKRVAPLHWDIIGGHVEPGEAIESALVRELDEELGISATEFILLASIPETEDRFTTRMTHHVFAVTAWTGGDPRNACEEHEAICWFSLQEVLGLPDTTPFDFEQLYLRTLALVPSPARRSWVG